MGERERELRACSLEMESDNWRFRQLLASQLGTPGQGNILPQSTGEQGNIARTGEHLARPCPKMNTDTKMNILVSVPQSIGQPCDPAGVPVTCVPGASLRPVGYGSSVPGSERLSSERVLSAVLGTEF